jgi:RNA polymerase sigma factor (sigma-70 family)
MLLSTDMLVGQPNDSEPLYQEFLAASDPLTADRLLEHLLTTSLEPRIRRFLRRRLGASLRIDDDSLINQDALDLAGEIRVALINALRRFRESPGEHRIRSIDAYASVVIRNFYNEYLRRKYPVRFRLRNQVRYVVENTQGMSMAMGPQDRTICVLDRHMANAPVQVVLNGASPDLRERLERSGIDVASGAMTAVVEAILSDAQAPVALDDLVAALAELRGIRETIDVEIDEAIEVRDHSAGPTDLKEFLTTVWRDILELPLRHRKVLLLHLADDHDDNLLIMFPVHGVASIRAIAAAVEMDADELARIWNRLPLPDLEIAKLMGLERQQVINLRQSARRSLQRRREQRGQ